METQIGIASRSLTLMHSGINNEKPMAVQTIALGVFLIQTP